MLPSYDEIKIPLLAELQKRGGQSRPGDKDECGHTIYSALAIYFALSDKDLAEKVYEENGTARSKWENMIRWVRNDLKKQKLLVAPSHGIWAISASGENLLRRTNNLKG